MGESLTGKPATLESLESAPTDGDTQTTSSRRRHSERTAAERRRVCNEVSIRRYCSYSHTHSYHSDFRGSSVYLHLQCLIDGTVAQDSNVHPQTRLQLRVTVSSHNLRNAVAIVTQGYGSYVFAQSYGINPHSHD